MGTELLGQKKVVPKILRPRTYWHQQFETSTGDKTQTGNILPGGETFCPHQMDGSRNQTNITEIPNESQANTKSTKNQPVS